MCSARSQKNAETGRAPWRLYQNYALDIVTLRFGQGRRRRDAVFVRAGLLDFGWFEIRRSANRIVRYGHRRML